MAISYGNPENRISHFTRKHLAFNVEQLVLRITLVFCFQFWKTQTIRGRKFGEIWEKTFRVSMQETAHRRRSLHAVLAGS